MEFMAGYRAVDKGVSICAFHLEIETVAAKKNPD